MARDAALIYLIGGGCFFCGDFLPELPGFGDWNCYPEGFDLTDKSGLLSLLTLIALCGVIVFVFWLTIDKGGSISALGKAEPAETSPSRHPIPSSSPAYQPVPSSPPAHPPRMVAAPREAARPSSGGTYKWVDENGSLHFSDRPMSADAQQVQISQINTYDYPQTRSDSLAQTSRSRQQAAPAVRSAQPVTRHPISAADYTITKYALQRGNDVVLSGRVSSGPVCESLHLSIRAESNKGRSIFETTVVNNVGSGGRLYEIVRRAPYPDTSGRPVWEITAIRASCVN